MTRTYARLRALGAFAPVEPAPLRWKALAGGRVPADSPVLPLVIRAPTPCTPKGLSTAGCEGAIDDCPNRGARRPGRSAGAALGRAGVVGRRRGTGDGGRMSSDYP